MNPARSGPGVQVSTPSDREIQVTRQFNAPRRLVFDAYTKPELIRQWLGALPGWTFEVCEVDLRVGGAYRYAWRGPNGEELSMGGTYMEIVPPRRVVTTERFDQQWYEGSCVGTSVFDEADGRTTLTMTMRYDSREIRDSVLKSPMASGLEAGFKRLDEILASTPA